MVAPAEVVDEEARLPGRAFGAPFGTVEPGVGVIIQALWDAGDGSKVVAGGPDAPQETTGAAWLQVKRLGFGPQLLGKWRRLLLDYSFPDVAT